MEKRFIFSGALSAAIAVILGAMAAHYLKSKVVEGTLTTENLQSFETGVKYQIYHSLALLILPLLHPFVNTKHLKYCAYLFLTGIILFSGSIYFLSLSSLFSLNLKFLGPITPIGGVCFIAGWFILAYSALRKTD